MSYLIELRHLQVENANAVAGLTWGFPAITHFLGYVHALSRKLSPHYPITLGGCAVICHQQQIHAHSNGYDYQFALTRNPLTKEAKMAPFNEEGRMHMTVSLLIECEGCIANGDIGLQQLAAEVQRLCQMQQLAGGTIYGVQGVRICGYPSPEQARRILCRLLPGFVLLDRSAWLQAHFAARQQQDPQTEMMDAWLDFAALKRRAEALDTEKTPAEGDAARWHYVAKPAAGYLVPLMTGYRRISELYAAGTVTHARDQSTPFCFTEAVYGLGEWRGLHRIQDLAALFWRYHTTEQGYYCQGETGRRTPEITLAETILYDDDDD